MLNIKSKWLLKFVTLMGIGVSLLGAGSVTANASSKYYDGHFDSKRITYHIDSASKHYRGIWKQAIKKWNEQGVVKLVNTNKKSKADIRMTTVKYIKTYPWLTTKQLVGDEIASVNIKVDRTYTNDSNFSDKNRINLATVTIGQSLGLKLNKKKNSIMNYYSDYSMANITSFDRANLKAAYKGIK